MNVDITEPNENMIKAALINKFACLSHKPFVVCNELTIAEDKIVDLVFCRENTTIACEVKAWNDDLRRLQSQLSVYCKIFDFIYVVTTENHLNKLKGLPLNVGLILYSSKTGKISFKKSGCHNLNIDFHEVVKCIPISLMHKKYKKLIHNNLYSQEDKKVIRELFVKLLRDRCRWTSEDLVNKLHFEDIIKNTDHIFLNIDTLNDIQSL